MKGSTIGKNQILTITVDKDNAVREKVQQKLDEYIVLVSAALSVLSSNIFK